jgi:hypothetical protein
VSGVGGGAWDTLLHCSRQAEKGSKSNWAKVTCKTYQMGIKVEVDDTE